MVVWTTINALIDQKLKYKKGLLQNINDKMV